MMSFKYKHNMFIGISLKLFIAFWLVIITSVVVSSLVTMQFKHAPTQVQANPDHLHKLAQLKKQLMTGNKIRIKRLQQRFYEKHHQYLFIKKLKNNKLYIPKKRIWSPVANYLESHTLQNPISINFGFTQVTTFPPVINKNQYYQLFIASKIERGFITNWVKQLPLAIRVIFLLSISFVCCLLLAKSFSKPLIAIKEASEAIGDGQLNTRIKKYDTRSDEFGSLARSFNTMASQLENNITAHQRLLGDVSHELRSPLTRLQLAIALAEKNIGNKNEQQKHLSRCETEVDRLDEMIADVLTLSRLEHNNNNNKLTLEKLELNSLTALLISDSQYTANDKNIDIKMQGKSEIFFFGDKKLLVSAISNVINNAVKYSPCNDSVLVSLNNDSDEITLTIADKGPGVPSEMINQLFKPFFRVADGRERKSGGTGLGLAIAQQAIQLHHGNIYAQNNNHGLTVIITLPI